LLGAAKRKFRFSCFAFQHTEEGIMKRALAYLAAVIFLAIIVAGLVSAKDEANAKFAAGDTVYVCPAAQAAIAVQSL